MFPFLTTEAALDANAPLEDEDEANAGPVDEEEETQAVMAALATWRPKPLITQPTFMPIKRQYQLARLREQLDMATNGGRTNIFAVAGANPTAAALKMPDQGLGLLDSEDAPGEPDLAGFAPPSRTGSTPAAALAAQRRLSVASRG